MFLAFQTGTAYALMLGSFITDRESLINIGPLINLPLMMLSGFYVNLNNVIPIIWLFQWISSMKYVFNILLRNELTGNNKILMFYTNENRDTKYYNTEQLLDLASVNLSYASAFISFNS
jgi:hypothetical protein